MLERWNRDAADVEVRPEVEHEHGTPRRHRAFIESRAFSKYWAFKFENMAAAVVPSSRDTLDWAAQQDTPILNVDDVEAGPDSVEINPKVYVALAELLQGEALDIVQNTTRGAGLEAWRKLVRRFDPQTVGRKRTLLSRIINPGTVNVHELSRAIEQWEERVRSHQSRAREKHWWLAFWNPDWNVPWTHQDTHSPQSHSFARLCLCSLGNRNIPWSTTVDF